MSVILGLSGALGHDASAALLVDGVTIAAAEEERFTRDKHARQMLPLAAARFCLEHAGLRGRDVQSVAFPYAAVSLREAARWRYALRHWYAPDRALDALFNGNRRFRRLRARVRTLCAELGIDWTRVRFEAVPHHLAHASSAYHLSGYAGRTAILCVDGKGEYATTWFGWGDAGQMHCIRQFYDPDSLAGVYGAMTQYLGFEMLDGEYKVMGMAPYGDAARFDFARLMQVHDGALRVNTRLVNTVGVRRYKDNGVGFYFSPALVRWLGPRRQGDAADEPYVHYAAAMQKLYEDRCLALIEHHLRPVLEAGNGKLVFAGGGALNVKLNQHIAQLPYVRELFVQPAAGDAGTALGAATYAAARAGTHVQPLQHVYLGPAYSRDACVQALAERAETVHWRTMDDPAARVADLLVKGHPVAWFHGRMEFGPRALGGRSILGCPSVRGVADTINAQIKFRERWRPFCPSMLSSAAQEMVGGTQPAPYMTITFALASVWRRRLPEVVHEDGTARIQVVDATTNPRYHRLLCELERRTGYGVVLNTSLNRRGEPMVCSPADALNMFFASDLQFLALEDLLVTRSARDLDA